MKKLAVLVLTILLAFGLGACSSEEDYYKYETEEETIKIYYKDLSQLMLSFHENNTYLDISYGYPREEIDGSTEDRIDIIGEKEDMIELRDNIINSIPDYLFIRKVLKINNIDRVHFLDLNNVTEYKIDKQKIIINTSAYDNEIEILYATESEALENYLTIRDYLKSK